MVTDEHRKHLSESGKLWWKINKEQNSEFIKQRNKNVSDSLIGKERLDLRHPTGRSPPNKGIRTGVIKNCEYCKKEFYVKPSGKNRRFCSHKCMGMIYRKDITYYLNPESIIHSQKAKKMFIEFIGQCEICGFNDIRILMPHHKDGNRKNNRRDNLIILCPNDHMLLHLTNGKLDLRGWHKE